MISVKTVDMGSKRPGLVFHHLARRGHKGRAVRRDDFNSLCSALRATRTEIANTHIAELKGYPPELAQLLRRRAFEKRRAICELLRREIRLRVSAWEGDRSYCVLERWNALQRRDVRGK